MVLQENFCDTSNRAHCRLIVVFPQLFSSFPQGRHFRFFLRGASDASQISSGFVGGRGCKPPEKICWFWDILCAFWSQLSKKFQQNKIMTYSFSINNVEPTDLILPLGGWGCGGQVHAGGGSCWVLGRAIDPPAPPNCRPWMICPQLKTNQLKFGNA